MEGIGGSPRAKESEYTHARDPGKGSLVPGGHSVESPWKDSVED